MFLKSGSILFLNGHTSKMLGKMTRNTNRTCYDKRHRVRETSPLPDNTDVWINTQGRENIPGQVIQRAEEPRSYLISTPSGEVRRTKSQIRVRAKTTSVPESELALPSSTTQTSRIATRSQTGTVLHPPDRYSNWVYTD